MCTSAEAWRAGVPRSPSHESVSTELSLFSVTSAASDARMLQILAYKAGQGPEPIRGVSPNPEGRIMKRPTSCLRLNTNETSRDLMSCAALCEALGVRRSFSAGDVTNADANTVLRNAISEMGFCAGIEALTVGSRSCSTWAAGGSQLPSPQRACPINNQYTTKIRQNYIKRRLLSTYRALERMSQSDFNLDKLEQAAVTAVSSAVAGPGPTVLPVPSKNNYMKYHPDSVALISSSADLERERGRPLSKYERNMMIFNWLHTVNEVGPCDSESLP